MKSETTDEFEPHRRRLTGLAYRMLGSLADAEDVVQEAYLRWRQADHENVDNPGAFLSRIVTRLCLDQLKSARSRRETYVGSWLPEPVLESAGYEADTASDYAQDLSVALLLTLERLSPLERAAFLLHDVFEIGFAEIAATLGRNEAACRQLAARGRAHVRAARPRFRPNPEEATRLTAAFRRAAETGDAGGLAAFLAEDAVLLSDGGGKRAAALNPILGAERIIRFFEGLARKTSLGGFRYRAATINGAPGFIVAEPDGGVQTIGLDIAEGKITAIYLVRNPDKLRGVAF
jgi:RNA polymerase sigma-70 factor (ECF subfamily)